MKTFRTAFPYVLDSKLPDNFEELLIERSFDGLTDIQRKGQGWRRVTDDQRLLCVDDKYLICHLASERKADAVAVRRLVDERINAAADDGREVSPELLEEFRVQAENEVIKYAPIKNSVVHLLLWPAKKLLIASGGTSARCEDALSYLRKTIDSLHALPWGVVSVTENAITDYMINQHGALPDDLIISQFGKTTFTGADSSLKVVLDGIQNDTESARELLNDLKARSVEMALIKRPDGGQIEYMANFVLHLPPGGNIHFKNFDYDDDVERDSLGMALIAEMHLVSAYVRQIIKSLQVFSGIPEDEDSVQE